MFAIATTNRVDVLEKALRSRPGRFDRVIEIPALAAAPTRALLAARLREHDIAERDLDWLAGVATGRTGAEVEQLSNTVLLRALETSAQPVPGRLRLSRELIAEALGLCGEGEGDAVAGF